MDKRAVQQLRSALEKTRDVLAERKQGPVFSEWQVLVASSVRRLHGETSVFAENLKNVSFAVPLAFYADDNDYEETFRNGVLEIEAIARAALADAESQLTPDPSSSVGHPPGPTSVDGPHRVFVVHGQSELPKLAAARLCERLGFEAIILHEKLDMGRTIIEKFEAHAADVHFAVVLLTGDDEGRRFGFADGESRKRARQNVLLELGFFIGRLGRNRVCALVEDGVEVPSDYSGVLFVPLDEHGHWMTRLAREMKGAGLPVDMNRLV